MLASTCKGSGFMIGIDIGTSNCKLAIGSGGAMELIAARMPENAIRSGANEGEVVSPETMAQFLKQLRAEAHIRERDCALVLPAAQVYFRYLTMPPMNITELTLNLPYEFRDYITGDPEEYTYDYAVDEITRDDTGAVVKMELYAAAVPKSVVETYSTMLRRAGFKLKMVTPAPMAYMRLIRTYNEQHPEAADKDVVLVDLGHSGVSISMYRGHRYDSMRTIDIGCSELDRTIADIKGIDPYTASNYKLTNFEGVLDDPDCMAIYDHFAVEVSKVVNFYNFNNPEREIGQLFFLGGGARIPYLTNAISEAVSVPTSVIDPLLPPAARGQENTTVCALAVAGALEGESI